MESAKEFAQWRRRPPLHLCDDDGRPQGPAIAGRRMWATGQESEASYGDRILGGAPIDE